MCAGCEAVYQTATTNPSLITMILGYVSAGVLLVMSYVVLFIQDVPQKLKRMYRTGMSLRSRSKRK